MAARKDHGFWPYLVPYFVAYLILVEIGGRTPPEFAGIVLALKAIVPLGLLIHYFTRQGAYPELRGYRWRPSEVGLDLLVGVAGAAGVTRGFVVGVTTPLGNGLQSDRFVLISEICLRSKIS